MADVADAVCTGKRRHVSRACSHCQSAKAGCNHERPCARCIRFGISDSCVDGVVKKRGPKPKGLKDEISTLEATDALYQLLTDPATQMVISGEQDIMLNDLLSTPEEQLSLRQLLGTPLAPSEEMLQQYDELSPQSVLYESPEAVTDQTSFSDEVVPEVGSENGSTPPSLSPPVNSSSSSPEPIQPFTREQLQSYNEPSPAQLVTLMDSITLAKAAARMVGSRIADCEFGLSDSFLDRSTAQGFDFLARGLNALLNLSRQGKSSFSHQSLLHTRDMSLQIAERRFGIQPEVVQYYRDCMGGETVSDRGFVTEGTVWFGRQCAAAATSPLATIVNTYCNDTTTSYNLKYVNPAGGELLGYSQEELKLFESTGWTTLFTSIWSRDELATTAASKIWGLMNGETTYAQRTVFTTKHGSKFEAMLVAEVGVSTQGVPMGTVYRIVPCPTL